MNTERFFAAADKLPFASLDALAGQGGVLVLAPHPDDEALGCGGLISLCAREDRACHIVVISDGTGSHPNSQEFSPQRLRRLREQESVAAVMALGLGSDDLSFLRLLDRFVPDRGRLAETAIRAIVAKARAIQASALFVTWPGDPHCDHVASFALAKAACARLAIRLLCYPIWGHRNDALLLKSEPVGWRLAIDNVLDQKMRAIRAHASQTGEVITDDPEGFVLDPGMIARFERPFEIFLRDTGL